MIDCYILTLLKIHNEIKTLWILLYNYSVSLLKRYNNLLIDNLWIFLTYLIINCFLVDTKIVTICKSRLSMEMMFCAKVGMVLYRQRLMDQIVLHLNIFFLKTSFCCTEYGCATSSIIRL